MNDDADENNADNNYRIKNHKATTSKYFEYQTNLTEITPYNNNNGLDRETVFPSKYLSNIWKYPDLHLVNCKTELDL